MNAKFSSRIGAVPPAGPTPRLDPQRPVPRMKPAGVRPPNCDELTAVPLAARNVLGATSLLVNEPSCTLAEVTALLARLPLATASAPSLALVTDPLPSLAPLTDPLASFGLVIAPFLTFVAVTAPLRICAVPI